MSSRTFLGIAFPLFFLDTQPIGDFQYNRIDVAWKQIKNRDSVSYGAYFIGRE